MSAMCVILGEASTCGCAQRKLSLGKEAPQHRCALMVYGTCNILRMAEPR